MSINFRYLALLKISIFLLLFLQMDLVEADDQNTREIVQSLLRRVPPGMRMFRWQTDELTDTLINSGTNTPAIHSHYSSIAGMAGNGIYLTRNAADAAEYGEDLLEASLKPGLPYLDLADPAVRATLDKHGIEHEVASRFAPATRFIWENGEDWWVSNEPNSIRFRPLNLASLPRDQFLEIIIAKSDEDYAEMYTDPSDRFQRKLASRLETLLGQDPELIKNPKVQRFADTFSYYFDHGKLRDVNDVGRLQDYSEAQLLRVYEDNNSFEPPCARSAHHLRHKSVMAS